MASGSLKALLTVLAVAGYQNRDKLGELLKKATGGAEPVPQPDAGDTQTASPGRSSPGLEEMLDGLRGGGGSGGLGGAGGLGGLGSILGGAGLGSILNGGLTDLIDQFRQAGQGGKADSWVNTGTNEPIDGGELQQALGPDVLRDIAEKTGLSEDEVLKRLVKNLPDAVDGLTPDGMVPPARRPL